jgi:putative PEP-CTERM system histidine kinase
MSGALSYSIAIAASLAACVALLLKSRNGDVARRAFVGAIVSAIWAAVLAGQALFGHRLSWVSLVAEALRFGAWLAVLHALAPSAQPLWWRRVCLAIGVVPVLYALAGWYGQYSVSFSLPLADMFGICGLVFSFIGLVNTEQVVRFIPGTLSAPLRMCVAGIGGLFAYDLFLFSQALLLGELDGTAWALRALVSALLLIPLVVGVRKMPTSEANVFVSRHVVFYSSAFLGVGIYLTLMAIGGYYVREHGGSWGNALQVVFLCGAVGILVSLLLSESPVRRLRVFIATHFYRNKYDYRITWLQFIETLSSNAGDDVRRTAVHAVAQVFSSPGGILFTHDEQGRQFVPVAAWPLPVESIPGLAPVAADSEMVAFIREKHWIIDLSEYRRSPGVYRHIELPPWFAANPNLALVSPLLELDRLTGFFVLYEPPPPFELTFEDRDLLKTVGRHVATQLAQHDADRKLAESRQFEAYNRLTAYMMHDLKNSVAQLGLLVSNAQKHKRNPEFIDDAIGTIANAVERMTRLIEQLRDLPSGSRAQQTVRLEKLVRDAVGRSSLRAPVPTLTMDDAEEIGVRADPERLAAVLDHVLRNAQEAATEGRVEVSLERSREGAQLVIRDTGPGMDPEFVRERLFRPFDSTKGSKGMGIGAYQAREYVQSVGGRVEVQSSPGRGTAFSIILPLATVPGVQPALTEQGEGPL